MIQELTESLAPLSFFHSSFSRGVSLEAMAFDIISRISKQARRNVSYEVRPK